MVSLRSEVRGIVELRLRCDLPSSNQQQRLSQTSAADGEMSHQMFTPGHQLPPSSLHPPPPLSDVPALVVSLFAH